MISILSEPGEIVFSKNPVLFKFSTDNLVSAPGQPYIGHLSFSAVPDTGNGFTLSFLSKELAFSFVNVPDDSSLQLTKGIGMTMINFLNQLKTELDLNYYINENYILSVDLTGSPRLKLTSRKNHPDYNLALITAATIALSNSQTASTGVANTNFRILAELWVKRFDQAEYQRVSEPMLAVDANGESYFDISDALTSALVAAGYDRPNIKVPVYDLGNKNICSYYIRYAEAFGGNQTVRRMQKTAVKYATFGGFSKAMTGELAFPGYFIPGGSLVKFLKQTPASVAIKPKQLEWLFWLNFLDNPEVKVRVTITYTTGSPITYIAHTFSGLVKYSRLIIPCGFLQTSINTHDARTVAQYQVVLINTADAEISETKTFLLDYKNEPYLEFFCSWNSFGGFDSKATLGKKSEEYELVANSASRSDAGVIQFLEGEDIQYSTTARHIESVTTGYQSRYDILRWKEFFLSPERFMLRNGLCYPVLLASKSIKQFEDGVHQFALSFDLSLAYVDEHFTAAEHEQDPEQYYNLNNWLPPHPTVTPPNFDDRYYLKTEVYNKAQIDTFLAAINLSFSTLNGDTQALLTQFITALENKADSDHDHEDLYLTEAQIRNIINQSVIFYAPWFDDVDLDNIFYQGVYTEHKGCLWVSLENDNYDEPSLESSKWEFRLGPMAYDVQVSHDGTTQAFKLEDYQSDTSNPFSKPLAMVFGNNPSFRVREIIGDNEQDTPAMSVTRIMDKTDPSNPLLLEAWLDIGLLEFNGLLTISR